MSDVKTVIQQLTLEQKCALLSGAATFKSRAMPQYGIPEIWLSDGPHGLRKQAGPADHLGQNPSEPATCFPTASARGQQLGPRPGRGDRPCAGRRGRRTGCGGGAGPPA